MPRTPRGSRGGAKSRGSPYPKTRSEDPASRSRGSPLPPSQSRQSEHVKKEAANAPREDGRMMKVTNKQEDKWDIAARILSQVIERDLELRCSDGTVVADQSVLAAVSKFLKEVFNSESSILSGGERRKADLVILLLPDIDCHTMYAILACFYWGFIPLISGTDMGKVRLIKVAWKLLQIDTTISQLETVDHELEIPGKDEARLVKTPRNIAPAPTFVRVKKEVAEPRPKRQATLNTNYAQMDEDDPDDPSGSEQPDVADDAQVKLENNYTFSMMEIHECIICKGKNSEGKVDKEAINLTFKDKTTVRKLREHYGKCVYTEGMLFNHVDPEDDNKDENGRVIDEFGKKYKYQCKVKGCWKQNKECGYKELAMHNAIEHGVLEKILELETTPKFVNLLGKIRASERRELAKTRPLKCRVTGCTDSEMLFENIQDYAKLQTHYAAQHYRAWFVNKEDGGKARNQKVSEPGRGTVCRNCRERVYGNEELMMGHYAYKHRRLADAVMEGVSGVADDVARNILVDLYPDRVVEFDRSREDSK